MKEIRNIRIVVLSGLAPSVLIIIGGLLYWMGFRINTTPSVAGIVWQLKPAQVIQKDQFVILRLPYRIVKQQQLQDYLTSTENGWTEEILLKRVIGISGDEVKITRHGISINGRLTQNTAKEFASAKLRAFRLQTKLGTNQYIVAGETLDSFDSRYFGVVEKTWIISSIQRIY